jgi:hypothetical protein
VRYLLNGVIHLVADDDSLPQCHGVEGYLHPDLTHIQAVGPKGTTTVARDRPVIAKSNESAQEISWEPRAVLARGPEEAILNEGTVGVVIHVHQKTVMKTLLTQSNHLKKVNIENCNKANSSKEKVKTGLFF